jgi:hypothetical protein
MPIGYVNQYWASVAQELVLGSTHPTASRVASAITGYLREGYANIAFQAYADCRNVLGGVLRRSLHGSLTLNYQPLYTPHRDFDQTGHGASTDLPCNDNQAYDYTWANSDFAFPALGTTISQSTPIIEWYDGAALGPMLVIDLPLHAPIRWHLVKLHQDDPLMLYIALIFHHLRHNQKTSALPDNIADLNYDYLAKRMLQCVLPFSTRAAIKQQEFELNDQLDLSRHLEAVVNGQTTKPHRLTPYSVALFQFSMKLNLCTFFGHDEMMLKFPGELRCNTMAPILAATKYGIFISPRLPGTAPINQDGTFRDPSAEFVNSIISGHRNPVAEDTVNDATTDTVPKPSTNFVTSLYEMIETMVKNFSTGVRDTALLHVAGPISAVAAAIYNMVYLVRTGNAPWHVMLVNCISLVASVVTLVTMITDVTSICNLRRNLIDAVMNTVVPGGAEADQPCSAKDWFPISTKLVGLCVCSLITVKGVNPLHRVRDFLSTANNMSAMATDVTTMVAKYVGWDFDGTAECAVIIDSLIDQCNCWLSVPTQDIVGQKEQELQRFIADQHKFLGLIKNNASNPEVQALAKKVYALDVLYAGLKQTAASLRSKPVPVGIYLHGLPGIGKNAFVEYLVHVLSAKFSGSFNNAIYTISESGTQHFTPYTNQHTIFFDELGARVRQPTGLDPLTMINALMSTTPVPAPGAALETKGQVLRPKLIACASNVAFERLNTPLIAEAAQAQKTRFMRYEVVDPLRPQIIENRQGWAHRQPDFSHLRFNRATAEGNYQLTASEMIQEVLLAIVQSHSHFANNQQNMLKMDIKPELGINGQPLILSDRPCAAEHHKHCTWLAGPPGSGKSSISVPAVLDMARACCYNVIRPVRLEDLDPDLLTPSTITLVVLDDLLPVDTKEGQQKAVDIWNQANDNVIFFVVSNYGPQISKLSPIQWYRCSYTQVPVLVPAFARRFGFEPGSEHTLMLQSTIEAFACPFSGDSVQLKDICTAWHRHVLNSSFPVALTSMPRDIPFTASEADLWMVCRGDESKATMIATALRRSTKAARAFVVSLSAFSFGDDPTLQLPMFFKNVALKKRDLRVYVKYGQREFMLNRTEFYCGTSDRGFLEHKLSATGEVLVRKCAGRPFRPVDRELVTAVFLGKPLEGSENDITDFLDLAKHRECDDTLWHACLAKHGPPPSAYAERFMRKIAASGKMVAAFLKENWKVALGMSTLIGAVAYIITQMSATTTSARPSLAFIAVLPRTVCKFCDLNCQRACPALNPQYIGVDLDEPCYKGKTKNRAARMNNRDNPVSYHHSYRIKKTWYVISDDETKPDENTKELLNKSKHHFTIHGGYAEPMGRHRFSYTGNDGKQYHYWGGYEKVGNDIAFNYDFDDIDEDAPCARTSWIDSQIIPLRNPSTGATLYGIALNDEIIRVGTHVLAGLRNGVDMEVVNTHHTARKIWDGGDDVSYLRVMKGTANASLSGVRDIVKRLVSVPNLKEYKRAVIVPADLLSPRYMTDWRFEAKLDYAINKDHQYIENTVAVVTYGALETTGLAAGLCGSPLIGVRNNEEVFLGQFSTVRPSFKHLIFTVATVEEWNRFMQQRATHTADDLAASKAAPKDAVTYVGAQVFLPPGSADRHAFMLPRVRRILTDFDSTDKTVSYLPHRHGLKPIYSVHGNKIPVDTNATRYPLCDHKFKDVFGLLKVPALPMHEVEERYGHLLPPDANGKVRAFAPRLSKAEGNVADFGDPEFERGRLKVSHYARELGEYWRAQLGFPEITPLSKLDAIWGNSELAPMKRTTSVGACFQNIYPGVTKKGDLFGPTRGEYRGLPGFETSEMIDEQWNAMKNGVEYIYPSSLSMKSECLLPSKLHKKRIIHIVDPVTVVNQRRLFCPFQQEFGKLEMRSPFILSANPLVDWDSIGKQLDRHPYKVALDVSSFDLTVPFSTMEAAADFMSAVAGSTGTYSKMLRAMCRMIANSPLLVENVLLAKHSGVCSGIWGTGIFDAVCQLIQMYLLVRDVIGPVCTPQWFFANFVIKCCGDDTVLAWSQQAHDLGFRADHLRTGAAATLKMTITSTVKEDGELAPLPMSEMSFCSRRFVKLTGFPDLYVGQLKAEAMSSALCWTKFSDQNEVREQLRAFAVEFVAWPDAYYERFIAARQLLFPDLEITPLKDLRREVRDQILLAVHERILTIETTQFRQLFKFADALAPAEPIPYRMNMNAFKIYEVTKDGQSTYLSPKTMFRRVRELFLTLTYDEFKTNAIIKDVLAVASTAEYVASSINRDGNVYTIESPQFFSPSMWIQLVQHLTGPPNILPSWILTVIKLQPYSNTKKEKVFKDKLSLAFAIADFLLRADPTALRNLLLVQDELMPTAHDLKPIQALVATMLSEDTPCSLEQLLSVSPQYRMRAYKDNGVRTSELHSHACKHCNEEFVHVHQARLASTLELTHCLTCRTHVVEKRHRADRLQNVELQKIVRVRELTNAMENIKLMTAAIAAESTVEALSLPQRSSVPTIEEMADASDLACARPYQFIDDQPCADRAPASATGGFVTGHDAAPAAAQSATGAPVGVANDPLPAVTTGNPALSMGVMAGEAATTALITTPGVIGPELLHQTGYGQNLLTLAGKKMFIRQTNINVGTAAGVVVLNEEISPWNVNLLNKPSAIWAQLHTRFLGQMRIHFEMVTCATLIGTLRVYVLPQLLADTVPLTLEALDAVPYMTLTVQSSGENYIDLSPTVGATPQTGVWRNGPYKNFGRVVVMTATRIQNTTDANVQIQLRVLASLVEGTIYDIPWYLISPTNDLLSTKNYLDLGLDEPTSVLAVDGMCCDRMDWSMSGEIMQDWLDNTAYNRNIHAVPYPGIEAAQTTFVSGGNAFSTEQISSLNDPFVLIRQNSIRYPDGYVDGNNGFKYTDNALGVAARGWRSGRDSAANGAFSINYTNVVLDADRTVFASKGYINFIKTNATPITYFAYVEGYRQGRTFGGLPVVASDLVVDADLKYNFTNIQGFVNRLSFWAESMFTIKVTNIPLCNRSSVSGRAVPSAFFSCRMVDASNIMPSVASGQRGTTIVAGTSHTRDMNAASHALRIAGKPTGSIITTIKGRGGDYIATVFRNRYGVFINQSDVPRHGSLRLNIANGLQEHELTGETWPMIPKSASAAFNSRVVTYADASVYVGANGKYGYLHSPLEPEDQFMFYDDMPCAALAPLVAAAGVSAGGDLIGKLLTSITGPLATNNEISKNLEAWKVRNATQFHQQQMLMAQTMNARALATGLNYFGGES